MSDVSEKEVCDRLQKPWALCVSDVLACYSVGGQL